MLISNSNILTFRRLSRNIFGRYSETFLVRSYSETFLDVIRARTKIQGLYIRNGHDLALDVVRVLHLDDISVLPLDVTPLFRRYS